MLGVLKRRWKPKRSNAVSKIPGGDNNSLDGDRDKAQLRPHQVHPVLDARQTIICYEKPPPPIGDRPPTPPPPSSHTSCYPLAPNICVEAGRIQFIRQESEGAPVPPPPDPALVAAALQQRGGRVTVTRGLQTEDEDEMGFREMQSYLENRISELESSLETAQKNELRDKQTINKLTKQLNRVSAERCSSDGPRSMVKFKEKPHFPVYTNILYVMMLMSFQLICRLHLKVMC